MKILMTQPTQRKLHNRFASDFQAIDFADPDSSGSIRT